MWRNNWTKPILFLGFRWHAMRQPPHCCNKDGFNEGFFKSRLHALNASAGHIVVEEMGLSSGNGKRGLKIGTTKEWRQSESEQGKDAATHYTTRLITYSSRQRFSVNHWLYVKSVCLIKCLFFRENNATCPEKMKTFCSDFCREVHFFLVEIWEQLTCAFMTNGALQSDFQESFLENGK